MKVSQEPQTITDILKDKKFTVPLYQREYSWSLDQVSDLYYDILEVGNENGHFLGSLLLYKEERSNSMEIVDGQQRMTTIFLLLFAILKAIESSDKTKAIARIKALLFIVDPNDLSEDEDSTDPRMEIGKRDKKLFKAIIRNEDYESHKDGRRTSHKNLTSTLIFFQKKLEGMKSDEGLNGLISFTEKVIKSEFIVMTAEKQSDKLLLFKTINARGLDLTQSDLIKNELCHNLKEFDIDEAIETWDEMRSIIEKEKGNLDTFMFHYINSLDESQEFRQELDKKRGVEKWDKKNYPPVPEKYVFDIYTIAINREGVKKFLQNILNAANVYTQFIQPENNEIYLSSLKSMGVNKCFPLFLSIKRKITNENFNQVSKEIDSLTFRHSILRNDPKELERFYYQLSDSIEDDSKVENAIESIKAHQNFKDEKQFKDAFIIARPKGSVAKMILSRIVRENSESIDWSNKDTHIEHIMPQKPTGEWMSLFEKDNDEYKDFLSRLGNLTILQDKNNIRARNKDFNDKKTYYAKSRLGLTQSLNEYLKWDYEEILARQTKLYEMAKGIWA